MPVPCVAPVLPVGAPSKKNDTGTCRICAICCNRLAPMRLVPFSYFCTCWKVRPRASPSFSWLMLSIIRRMRTREPTCLSMGLGAFLAAIKYSYAPILKRNVTPDRLYAIGHLHTYENQSQG